MGFPRLQHDDTDKWFDVGLNVGGEGGAPYNAGTARSTARTGAGEPLADKQRFSYAGMSGSFEHHHGLRERPIFWEGQLRVTTAALRTIQAQRDAFTDLEGTFTFYDHDNTPYEHCTIEQFEIFELDKWTISDDATLDWGLPYRIVLIQLTL